MWNLRAKTPQQEQATVPWHQVFPKILSPCFLQYFLLSSPY